MDNSTSPNSPYNPNPSPDPGAAPTPQPDLNATPGPVIDPTPSPVTPDLSSTSPLPPVSPPPPTPTDPFASPTAPTPTSSPVDTWTPTPPSDPTPAADLNQTSSPFPASPAADPATPSPDLNSSASTFSPFSQTAAQPNPVPSPEPQATWPPAASPVPTATPDITIPSPNPNPDPMGSSIPQAPVSEPQQASSPLDNPWGAPAQPPQIDGGLNAPPSWSQPPNFSGGTDINNVPTAPSDSAPTDLSHLISGTQPVDTNTPSTQAETLVVPSTSASPEVPTIPTEGKKGIPKWLIGVGAGLLLVVAGASAYFILGIGQAPKTTSVPAETKTSEVKPTAPVATPPISQPTPASSTQPVASGSANFGQLGGASPTPQATSAADLIRQRQQQTPK